MAIFHLDLSVKADGRTRRTGLLPALENEPV
jgi:hypothetical protein